MTHRGVDIEDMEHALVVSCNLDASGAEHPQPEALVEVQVVAAKCP